MVHYYNGEAGLQEDLMCYTTTMKNPTQQSVDGETIDYTVDLEFMHVCTHLRFQYLTKEGVEVRVKAMTLHNVISKAGFYNHSSGTFEWATYGAYAEDTRPNYLSMPMEWGETDFVWASHTPVPINGANDLMVFPQEVGAWVPSDATIAANDTDAKLAYLKIYCDIENSHGTGEIGDDTTYSMSDTQMEITPDACIYVPISSDGLWEAGNIVTYTLTFGTG